MVSDGMAPFFLIYSLLPGQLDMVIIGAGTGGTVTGIGRKMKEKMPNVEVIIKRAYLLLISYICRSLVSILLVLFWPSLKNSMTLLPQHIRYYQLKICAKNQVKNASFSPSG